MPARLHQFLQDVRKHRKINVHTQLLESEASHSSVRMTEIGTKQKEALIITASRFLMQLERVKGIEPSPQAWEAGVLPLNYTRTAREQEL